jgi:NAD(P)-dependent dehydrogenase (short-subunit alcohol dehydrogenase family)
MDRLGPFALCSTAALPALTANLALEIAPVRVNLIAAGFVDTPLSAELLGDQLEKRRDQLRTTLPIDAWSDRRTWRRSPYIL